MRISHLLKYKFRNAFELYERMTQFLPEERPDCEEILNTRHLWSLGKNEFTIDGEMKKLICSANEEKLTIYSILKSKLFFANLLENAYPIYNRKI